MDAVLNWLVQGLAVALAAAVVVRAIPRSRTQARYAFVWAASITVLLLPAWAYLPAASVQPAAEVVAPMPGPIVSMPVAWWTSTAIALALWIGWFGLSAARVTTAGVALRAARRRTVPCPRALEMRLEHWWRLRGAGRRTRLVLSTDVRAAAVLGGGRPIIAVNPAMVDGLSDADLDRIVIHEWAHVQRRDDIAQFAQVFVRALAGWHPAIWWLQRQLDFEREIACDEIAIAATGSIKGYASCLATLAACPAQTHRPLPVLSAVPAFGLRRRLTRILAAPRGAVTRPWRAVALGASAGLFTLSLTVGNLRVAELAAVALTLPAATPPRVVSAAASVSIPGEIAAPSSAPRPVVARRSNDSHAQASRAQSGVPALLMIDEPAVRPATPLPVSITGPAPDSLASRSLDALTPPVAVVESVRGLPSTAAASETPPRLIATTPTPWAAAADAGVAIGRGSQNAGVATAGFFSRFGKKIAASF